ncbi:MAG: methyl-accepting chemotaxis protein [Alphaproteobacteria bacterium]
MGFVTTGAGAFNDLRIATRVSLAFVLPLVALLWFSAGNVLTEHRTMVEMESLDVLAGVGARISAAVHELQRERGSSALFLGSKGQKFGDRVDAQRQATDAQLATLRETLGRFDFSAYGPTLADAAAKVRTALDELPGKRRQVTAQELAVPQMAGYYTGTIASMLDVVSQMAVLSQDVRVSNLISAYVNFLKAKERTGQERAMGSAGFSAGKFAPAIYQRFVELIAEQNVFLGQFKAYAAPDQVAFLERTVSGRVIEDVTRMREIALKSPEAGNTGGVEAPSWFETVTAKIDLQKQVEDRLAADLRQTSETLADTASRRFRITGAVVLVLLVATVSSILVIIRGIVGPISEMTLAMGQLARRDFSARIPGLGRRDEIGAMAQAVEVFKENMIKADELAETQRIEQEKKEARRLFLERRSQEFDKGVSGALQGVAAAADEMQATAGSMTAIATRTSEQADSVATAADGASTNVQTVAAAAEQLSASIAEISRQVSQSSKVAADAVEEARRTNETVAGMAEAAERIGEAVKLITNIAAQTNLLALNATIEAARAGDAGKGFAVVAGEVKSLANQTAHATEEISRQIGAVQGATRSAVEAIRVIGGTIGRIDEATGAIAAAVEEQGAATREIARNVEKAAAGTQEVSGNIDGLRYSANETGSSATQVLEATGELSRQAATLKNQVEHFLRDIRHDG